MRAGPRRHRLLPTEVLGEAVDDVGELFPVALDALDVRLSAELALRANFEGDALDLDREAERGERISSSDAQP